MQHIFPDLRVVLSDYHWCEPEEHGSHVNSATHSISYNITVNLGSVQAYMVLYESADHHSGNQRKLRDPKILGG